MRDRGGSAAAPELVAGVVGERLKASTFVLGTDRWHSAPSKVGPTTPKVDLRPRFSGSRFWALSEELSSDEEDDIHEAESGLLPTEEFLHDALAAGYTVDDVLMAEAQLLAIDVPSPEVCSISGFAGRRVGRLASRLVQDIARQQATGNLWRGPLPARRSSPRLTLADAMAKAVVVSPASAWHGSQGGSQMSSSPAVASTSGRRPLVSNFEIA